MTIVIKDGPRQVIMDDIPDIATARAMPPALLEAAGIPITRESWERTDHLLFSTGALLIRGTPCEGIS